MKHRRASARRTAPLPLAVLLVLVPVSLSTSQAAPPPAAGPSAGGGAAGPASHSLLYDPGPSRDCHSMLIEEPPDKNTAVDPARVSSKGCDAFDRTKEFTRENWAAPVWDLGTFGYNHGSWGQSPGYSFAQTPQTGAVKTVTMKNDATGTCGLRETNVSYTYSGSQIKPGPLRKRTTLADGRVNVSYDARIDRTGGFGCDEKRALLTTDFIVEDAYHGSGSPHVISVVHYDPGNYSNKDTSDVVLWNTLKPGMTSCPAGGCRVMLRSDQKLTEGRQGRVDVDFSRLFQEFQHLLNPRKLPASAFVLRGVQVVSSNNGSTTTTSVSDVDTRLTPGAWPRGPLTYGVRGDGGRRLCLDDYGNATTSPAVVSLWECNGGAAQNWQTGPDSTLRVNGLCLDAAEAGTANGTPVILYTCNGGRNQKWVLGRYDQVYHPASGRCLEVEGASVNPGRARLQLFDCWGGAHQKWTT
ncbi:RICIN domain-containing protein [Streptomyces sp. ODS05-4]|uniref:RICIN domain-containing protein n=1 Tax=Streptomyces sp. ODS05-4 TaxID=2944939 RepID=UPI00210A7FA8|nr:RICIN domain-containing protein [Streptomyces sp. ODS05-4]